MKRYLEHILNTSFKDDLEILFGKNSYVRITNCSFVTNTNGFIVDCKILVSDINQTLELYPDSLVFLVKEAWKFTNSRYDLSSVVTSIDLNFE
jgi:hypothetical protein